MTAVLVLGSPASAQESVRVAGTSVTLTPPPGFTARARGFENEAGSSITISERSADDYAELAATFKSAKDLSAAYAEQKVLIRGVRQLSTPTGPALFASGTQSTNSRQIVKYLALLKGDKTVLVAFNIVDRAFFRGRCRSRPPLGADRSGADARGAARGDAVHVRSHRALPGH